MSKEWDSMSLRLFLKLFGMQIIWHCQQHCPTLWLRLVVSIRASNHHTHSQYTSYQARQAAQPTCKKKDHPEDSHQVLTRLKHTHHENESTSSCTIYHAGLFQLYRNTPSHEVLIVLPRSSSRKQYNTILSKHGLTSNMYTAFRALKIPPMTHVGQDQVSPRVCE